MTLATWARALLCTAALASCAGTPRWESGKNVLDDAVPELLLRLPPASLGRSLALQQHLRVEASSTTWDLDALLEADAQQLHVALLVMQRPAARLLWDGQALQQQTLPGWPAAVSAERILSDLVFVFWPANAIALALPEGWSLHESATTRELRWMQQAVVRVRWESAQRLHFEHLRNHYRMQVDSVTAQD